MTTLKLDDDGEIAIENNRPVLISGAAEILQRVRLELSLYEGEWFLDTRIGVPYFREILGVKPISGTRIASVIKRAILSCPGVAALLEYDQTIDDGARSLTVSFRALGTDGSIITSTEDIG